MKRLLSMLLVIFGVALLACSVCFAEEFSLKEDRPGVISFFNSGFDGPAATSDRSMPFLGVPLGAYRLEGDLQLDQKKSSPIDIGKEKESIFSIQFSIKW